MLLGISFLCLGLTSFAQSGNEVLLDDSSVQTVAIGNDSATLVINAYTELEPQLLADIEWLNYTPVNRDKAVQQDKSRFVLMWMSGSPTVSIKIDDRVMNFSRLQPWAILAYMMGWTKYSLENDYSIDQVKCTAAGINNMVGYYRRNKEDLSKDKEVDRLAVMVDTKTLENHLRKVLQD